MSLSPRKFPFGARGWELAAGKVGGQFESEHQPGGPGFWQRRVSVDTENASFPPAERSGVLRIFLMCQLIAFHNELGCVYGKTIQ